jgi:hypothetical protein
MVPRRSVFFVDGTASVFVKTERRGTMVAAVKPSDHKVKLQDVVRPPDIKIVKPINSPSDIDSLLIRDLGEYLHMFLKNIM